MEESIPMNISTTEVEHEVLHATSDNGKLNMTQAVPSNQNMPEGNVTAEGNANSRENLNMILAASNQRDHLLSSIAVEIQSSMAYSNYVQMESRRNFLLNLLPGIEELSDSQFEFFKGKLIGALCSAMSYTTNN